MRDAAMINAHHQALIDDLRDLAARYSQDSAMSSLCRDSADAIAALCDDATQLHDAVTHPPHYLSLIHI